MSNLLLDVKRYLENQTLGDAIPTACATTLGFGRNLFIGREPASPLSVVTIYPTGGPAPNITRLTSNPTFQVRIREISWSRGYEIGNAFIKQFHENMDVCGSVPGKIFAVQSSPIPIGPNEEDTTYAFNCDFMVKHVRY